MLDMSINIINELYKKYIIYLLRKIKLFISEVIQNFLPSDFPILYQICFKHSI